MQIFEQLDRRLLILLAPDCPETAESFSLSVEGTRSRSRNTTHSTANVDPYPGLDIGVTQGLLDRLRDTKYLG